MNEVVFITGNQNKAEQLANWLDLPIEHQKVDLDEIQSLDTHEIVEHKARQAYEIVKKPVLVEDVSLKLSALDGLPGPFIKWFEQAGLPTLCRMLDGFSDRSATAQTCYGLYDGNDLRFFDGVMRGIITEAPRGDRGFGFDTIFINEGYDLTRSEMSEEDYAASSYRKAALAGLKSVLTKL